MGAQLYKLEFSIDSDLERIAAVEDALSVLQELFPDEIASYSVFEKQEHISWDVSILFSGKPSGDIIEQIFTKLDVRPEYELKAQEDVNWLQKNREEFAPFEVGPYFIYGSFDRDNVKIPENSYPIQIDAATAFGSGRHNTTKGCLVAIDEILSSDHKNNIKQALDLGCGSGILAIAIAKGQKEKTEVLAIDNDQEAIRVAKDNCEINNVSDFVNCMVGDGMSSIAKNQQFDLIVANILAMPLISMSADIAHHLRPSSYDDLKVREGDGSRLVLSGILNEQAGDVIAAYKDQGLELLEHKKLGDWSTIIFTK